MLFSHAVEAKKTHLPAERQVNWSEELKLNKEQKAQVAEIYNQSHEKIKSMMSNMRNKTIEKIGDYKVIKFRDVDRDYEKDMITGKESKTGLPKSNVLYYELENNSWCCVRPSGTEPKIKLYMGIKGENMEDAKEKLEKLKIAMNDLVRNA